MTRQLHSRRQRKTSTRPPHRRLLESPITWVLTIIVGAAIGAFIIVDQDTEDPMETSSIVEVRPVTITSGTLPILTDPDVAVGVTAPTFSATTLDGESIDTSAAAGARLYGFFAHWCPHCQAELPRIAAWLAANGMPADVEVLAVSTAVDDSASNYPPSEWFAAEAFSGRVILDDENGSLASAFGLTAFPYWVAVDADGRVVSRLAGELSTENFEALLTVL